MDITLRPIYLDDQRAFLAAVARSNSIHHPWVSPPGSPEAFGALVEKVSCENNASFLAVNTAGEIVGCINLNEIVRGAFLSAYLGYYAFAPFEGKGLMKRAMALVIAEAFGPMGLHRLEANIQPGNTASIALVKALGFRHEGHSPRYLKIGGQWRDHDRYALTADE